jgi:hypothetical protein
MDLFRRAAYHGSAASTPSNSLTFSQFDFELHKTTDKMDLGVSEPSNVSPG